MNPLTRTMLLAVLMLLQTLAVVSDVSVVHIDEAPHEVTTMHHDEGAVDVGGVDHPERHGDDVRAFAGDCHSCHCHGPHTMLVPELFSISPPLVKRFSRTPPSQDLAGLYDRLLRPPIV